VLGPAPCVPFAQSELATPCALLATPGARTCPARYNSQQEPLLPFSPVALIHRSAQKGSSPKSEVYEASSRASKATRKDVILPSSMCSQLATYTGEATVVCMSYQVSTSWPSTKIF
jgi:hypothetical protein